MRISLIVILATAWLWSCGGEGEEKERGRECNLLYQFCGLALNFDTASWSPGSWRFEVEADGDLHSCTIDLPIQIASKQLCGNNSMLTPLWNAEDGAAFPGRFELNSAPASATIRIWHEGDLVETQKIKPRYDKTRFGACDEYCLVHETLISF